MVRSVQAASPSVSLSQESQCFSVVVLVPDGVVFTQESSTTPESTSTVLQLVQMSFWSSSNAATHDSQEMVPAWGSTGWETARQLQQEQAFEDQMFETASQGRRMVHNERFLNHTLRDTTSHNLRVQGLKPNPRECSFAMCDEHA